MKRRPGAILIEMIFALAILVGAALAISTSVRGGLATARAMRDQARSADLAASAMAQIEAGIATLRDLDGPVPEWREDIPGVPVPDAPPADSEWTLEVQSERSGVSGLTHVTVTAWRAPEGATTMMPGRESDRRASFTLHRLLLLSRRVGEDENPEDALAGELLLPPASGGSAGGGTP